MLALCSLAVESREPSESRELKFETLEKSIGPSGGKTGHRIPRKKYKILTLPVAQQWHLSDRRTPRVHKTLHVGDKLLLLRGGLPLAPPYRGRGRSSDCGYN